MSDRIMTQPGLRRAVLAVALVLLGACSDGDGALEPILCDLPTIASSSAVVNPANVLSSIVSVATVSADSVAVRWGLAGATLDSVTPAFVPVANSVVVPVLGLRPSTSYAAQVVAYNSCGTTSGVTHPVNTGALPSDIPVYTASGADPSPGYVVFAAGTYGLVIDNTGRVVWYHQFPDGPGLNFETQPNGRFAARPPSSSTTAGTGWVELDPLGTVRRTLGCAKGLTARVHDLMAQPDGSYWILCDETRVLDLSSVGGAADARVMGTVVQHVGANNQLLFEWTPFDHFAIDESVIAENQPGTPVLNWTHGNALDIDADGNLLVSFRNLHEVTKINTTTGAVIWRMGGEDNEFTFEPAAGTGFNGQHGVRAIGNSRLVLLDNLGDQTDSRAERYEFDEAQRTVRLTASYASSPAIVGRLGGSTQTLPGGRTLVSFGNGGRVEEYDGSGNVVWRIEGNPGYVFRAQRIRSLYSPGLGDPR